MSPRASRVSAQMRREYYKKNARFRQRNRGPRIRPDHTVKTAGHAAVFYFPEIFRNTFLIFPWKDSAFRPASTAASAPLR